MIRRSISTLKQQLNPAIQETCCQARELVDCTGRQDYPPATCPNPAPTTLTTYKYPADPTLFSDWRLTLESTQTAYRPLLILLVQIVSSFAAYQLAYFAFETRIEIFGFAIPMMVGPLVVVGSLVAACGSAAHVVGQDGCHPLVEHIPTLASVFFSCSGGGADSLAGFLAEHWIFMLAFAAQVPCKP